MVTYIKYKNSIKIFGLMYYENEGTKFSEIFVTDKLIKKYLDKEDFIDVSDGKSLNNTREHHAQRVASLIHLITMKNMQLAMRVWKDDSNTYHVFDGCHRIRAYQYLERDIPCCIEKMC